MPDGVIRWFDPKTGEAEIARRGRLFMARSADIDSVARRVGARVHFDIRRTHGVERAVDVRLRKGARVSRHHRQVGTLVGARRIDAKGPSPYSQIHPELRSAGAHPLELAGAWAMSMARGDVPGLMALYAPDAVVHIDGESLNGRALRAWIEDNPLLGCGRHARIHGGEATVDVSWGADRAEPGMGVRCRIDHAQIVEQWVSRPEPSEVAASEERTGPLQVEVSTKGEVGDEIKHHAHRAIVEVAEKIDEPVLSARVKLTWEPDPARLRPAVAQVTLSVNGNLVRAQSAAHSMPEAIDLLVGRLRDQLEHRGRHQEHLHRLGATPRPDEWRHGDQSTVRPSYFDRPEEERQLVRHKTFAVNELTPDEAVFDMEQLDYDFYLFSDLASGVDSIIERLGGSCRLTRVTSSIIDLGPTAAPVEVSDTAPPVLDLGDAIERLNAGGEPHVFFANATTGRGNVLYRRYDGHYGLITPG